MTDKEIRTLLDHAIGLLEFRGSQGRPAPRGLVLKKLKDLRAALEANPPLAGVEGCDLHRYSNSPTMYHLESVFESQGELCEEGITILVTATLRKS